MTSRAGVTALVLAASRHGADDPVARLENASHKCVVAVDTKPMIEHVVQALQDSGCIGRILVSIESAEPLLPFPTLRRWLETGEIEITASADNLADSVVSIAADGSPPVPLLITTADNVLHTAEVIRTLVSGALAQNADVSIGVTREETVRAEFQSEPLGFFRFRDGGYSFCNVFMMHSQRGFEAAELFRGGGQFRKRPARILSAFGLWNLIAYRFRLRSLADTFTSISNRLGIALDVVELPFPFAPIDVDNTTTHALSQRVLAARRGATDPAAN